MKFVKFIFAASFIGAIAGCSSLNCEPDKKTTGYALPGTETVVVGISIGKDGMPQESYKNVVVHPGQKVIYAGPSEFSILFKNRKTPNGKIENPSTMGVVIIDVPLDIFKQKQFIEEFRKNNELIFDYGIKANGKELDPPMIIRPR